MAAARIRGKHYTGTPWDGTPPVPSVYVERRALQQERDFYRHIAATAIRALELLQRGLSLMARQAIDNALAQAQHHRTEARLAWIDAMIDGLIAVWPERKAELEIVRIDLHTANIAYVETLNAADAALINRVTAILLNEQLAREAGDEALQKQIGGQP